MRIRRPLLLAASVLAVSTVALAQQSADGPYVLHEFFVAKAGPTAGGGASPETAPLEYGAGQPPPLSLETQSGEPIYDKDGPVLNEPPAAPYGPLTPFGGSNTLDDRTDRVDSLTYYANFDPSVIPYKRVVVQNHVVRRPGGEYAIEVVPGDRIVVPVESAAPDDDLFWGSFLLRLEANRWQPIASVAPGQRLLDLQVEPDIAIEVYRDEADNYFLRSRQSELVRVNMHLAASRFYFSGEFSEVAWQDFPRDLVPPMAPELVNTGLRVARQLGFDRQAAGPRDTLMAMIAYFRNFDARPFPEELDRGDLFEAIATSQIGVCRHRSLAFVIMAQAMGIPTRYVYNEAHAFVEVYWPAGGWRRVDLGGAADELNASATANRSLHNAGSDDLPTPERFLQEQQRMERNGWNPGNPSDESGGGDGSPDEGARGDGAGEGEGEGGGEPTTTAEGEGEQGEGVAAPSAPATEPQHDLAAELITPDADLQPEPPPTDLRADTRLAITDATAIVRRGGDMLLQGQLSDADGNPLAGKEVEIYLGPVGSTEARSSQRLGSTVTDRFGRLGARVVIPREHSIGRWSLFLVFGGDETHRPAIAE